MKNILTISFLVILTLFIFVLPHYAQFKSYNSIGKHQNSQCYIKFSKGNDGNIYASVKYCGSCNVKDYESTPRSGSVTLDNSKLFPLDKIKKEMGKDYYLYKTFNIDYEVLKKSDLPILQFKGKVLKVSECI